MPAAIPSRCRHHHHLMRRLFARPRFDQGIERLAIGDPRGKIGKTRIGEPFLWPTISQNFPFFLGVDRDHAPAIIAFATIAAMRRGGGAKVALGLRLAAVDEIFQ